MRRTTSWPGYGHARVVARPRPRRRVGGRLGQPCGIQLQEGLATRVAEPHPLEPATVPSDLGDGPLPRLLSSGVLLQPSRLDLAEVLGACGGPGDAPLAGRPQHDGHLGPRRSRP